MVAGLRGRGLRWVRFAHFDVRGTLWNILEGLGARWVRFAHFGVRGTLWNILEGLARWVCFAPARCGRVWGALAGFGVYGRGGRRQGAK